MYSKRKGGATLASGITLSDSTTVMSVTAGADNAAAVYVVKYYEDGGVDYYLRIGGSANNYASDYLFAVVPTKINDKSVTTVALPKDMFYHFRVVATYIDNAVTAASVTISTQAKPTTKLYADSPEPTATVRVAGIFITGISF